MWDVDDVLNDLMHEWFLHEWLAEHLDCSITYDELTCNPPHDVLGVERSAYLESMDRFRRTDRARQMMPNPEIQEWFQERGHLYRHIALTARPLESAPDVAWWVMHHFGSWIRCFGVVPTRGETWVPVYDLTKADFLGWLRCGDVLVDDLTDNIIQAEALGLRALQPNRPWNHSVLSIRDLLAQLSQMVGES